MPNTSGLEIDWIVNGAPEVANLEDLTVDGRDRDPELAGTRPRQLWDIGGHFPVVDIDR